MGRTKLFGPCKMLGTLPRVFQRIHYVWKVDGFTTTCFARKNGCFHPIPVPRVLHVPQKFCPSHFLSQTLVGTAHIENPQNEKNLSSTAHVWRPNLLGRRGQKPVILQVVVLLFYWLQLYCVPRDRYQMIVWALCSKYKTSKCVKWYL